MLEIIPKLFDYASPCFYNVGAKPDSETGVSEWQEIQPHVKAKY